MKELTDDEDVVIGLVLFVLFVLFTAAKLLWDVYS